MRYLIVIACLVMVGCSQPPYQDKTEAKRILEVSSSEYSDCQEALQSQYDHALTLEKFEDSKFALFRSYGESKSAYVKVLEIANDCTNRSEYRAEKTNLSYLLENNTSGATTYDRLDEIERELNNLRKRVAKLEGKY